MLLVCAFAAVPAAALALYAILLRRHGVRPRSLLIVTPLDIPPTAHS